MAAGISSLPLAVVGESSQSPFRRSRDDKRGDRSHRLDASRQADMGMLRVVMRQTRAGAGEPKPGRRGADDRGCRECCA